MTELETMQRAKMYLDKLAQGIDPISGVEIPEDSILNNVRLARCFFYVSGVLKKVIDNGGVVVPYSQNSGFFMTQKQLATVSLPGHSMRITQFIDLLWTATENPNMKRPGGSAITNWLVEKEFLEKVTNPNGKQHRIPTDAGRQIGIYTEMRQGQHGEYEAVLYSKDAQQFLLDHIQEIFTIVTS
jgi:hypothetical protein